MQYSKDKIDYATKIEITQHSKDHITPFMNHRKDAIWEMVDFFCSERNCNTA